MTAIGILCPLFELAIKGAVLLGAAISIEKIMAPMVAGITKRLITEMEDFSPFMLLSAVFLGCVSGL